MRQTSFQFFQSDKNAFGGSLLAGKRKTQRPLSIKTPIHLVLKSEQPGVFKPGNRSLEKRIHSLAEKFHIQIHELAINWSHIHFIIQMKERKDYNRFIRALTSKLAQAVRKARPQLAKLFSLRPFTRILSWGRDFYNACKYLWKNQMEALGLSGLPLGLSKRDYGRNRDHDQNKNNQVRAKKTAKTSDRKQSNGKKPSRSRPTKS